MTTRSVVREAPAIRSTAGRIDRLVARASVCAEEVRGHLDAAASVASEGAREARERRTAHDREAWRVYGERVAAVAADAEIRLVEARAELDLALAESRDDLHDATERLLDQWRGRVDDLRVQAALGRLEAAEEVEPSFDRLDDRLRRVGLRLADLREAPAASLDVLRTGVTEAIDLVSDAFDDAVVALRPQARRGRRP